MKKQPRISKQRLRSTLFRVSTGARAAAVVLEAARTEKERKKKRLLRLYATRLLLVKWNDCEWSEQMLHSLLCCRLLLLQFAPPVSFAHKEIDGRRFDVVRSLLQHVADEILNQNAEFGMRAQVLFVLETSAFLEAVSRRTEGDAQTQR